MMRRSDLFPLARRLLRRNWEAFIFVFIGQLLVASLQMSGDLSESDSRYVLVKKLVDILSFFKARVMPVLHPLAWPLVACYCVLPLSTKWRRLLADIYALWFIVRISVLFLLINLVIFFKVPDHAQLIAQLLIFLACLLAMWGWIYWRVDTGSRIASGEAMFDFKLPEGTSPTIYDYFLVSFTSLISNTLNGFSGKTRTARTLIFVHGLMMWDVMGLMLTRAIALVSA